MEPARSIFQSNPVSEKLSNSPFGDSFTLPTYKGKGLTRLQQVLGVDQPAVVA